MRLLIIGSVFFSEAILIELIQSKFNIVGVIAKNTPNFNADYVDLSLIANEYGIDSILSDDINSMDTVKWVKSKNVDIILCVGWSQLINKDLLDTPKLGIIGYHPSDLPNNRGRHPLIWALALGLKQTASTFFLMDEGPDSGGILSKKYIKIDFDDYAIDLYSKMIDTAKKQVKELMNTISEIGINSIPQSLSTGNIWRKRGINDGRIDLRMSSESIYNLVRALSKPYPGAHIEHKGHVAKVWKTEVVKFEKENLEPGKIIEIVNKTILVKTYDGAIRLIDHEIDFELFKLKNYLGL